MSVIMRVHIGFAARVGGFQHLFLRQLRATHRVVPCSDSPSLAPLTTPNSRPDQPSDST
jgi:hypothetical protein